MSLSFSLGQISPRVANPVRSFALPVRRPRKVTIKASLQNELLQVGQASGDVVSFLQDNPLLLAVGGGLVAVPLLVAGIVGGVSGGKKIKSVSAAAAYEALAEDDAVILIDIRPRSIINEEGSPDIRGTGKKLLQIPFTKVTSAGEEEYVEQFNNLVAKKVSEDKVITLIDAFGQLSQTAAKQLIEQEVVEGTIYIVEGGCNGFKGWKGQNGSGLPWREPYKFNLGQALNPDAVAKTASALTEQYKKNPTLVNGALAVAGVAGATTLLFTEVETLLEVVGVVGVLQFIASKLLFAEDRKKTLKQFRELLNDKIAAGEAGKDLKRLADALLESEDKILESASKLPQNGVSEKQQEQKQEEKSDNVAEAEQFVEAWKSRKTEEKMTQAVESQNITAST